MELNLTIPNEQARKFKLQKLFTNKVYDGPNEPDHEKFIITIESELDLFNFWLAAWSVGYNMCSDVVDKIADSKPVKI